MIGNGVARKMLKKVVHRLRNGGSGYRLSLGLSLGVIGGTLYFGRSLKSELNKCGLAGTSSTLIIEFATFGLSTLDMNAKTTQNFRVRDFIKQHGIGGVFKGFQPYWYGWMLSSFMYYYFYKQIKEKVKLWIRKYGYNEKSILSVALMSAGASAICEMISISIYYPFDLVKARMQRSGNYNYTNTSDGFYQIFKTQSNKHKFFDFYKGVGIYSLSYGLFTILEFTFYEAILVFVTNLSRKYKSASELDSLSTEHGHAKRRNVLHVFISAFFAGALSAVIWNPLELTLYNFQNAKGKSMREIVKEFKSIRKLFQGVHLSVLYYGFTSWLLFVTLEKMWEILDCQISEAE